MTVTYAGHPRGYQPEAAEAVHMADGMMAAATWCERRTGGRQFTATPELVTCRECRERIGAHDD